jgi:hypothetical protein
MEGPSVNLQKQSSHTFDLFMEDEDGSGPDGVTVVFLPMNEIEKDFNLENRDWEEIAICCSEKVELKTPSKSNKHWLIWK